MSTKSIYFPHFSNALQDEKILKLRKKHSITGYGVYFALLEKLSATNNYQLELSSIEDLAFDLRIEASLIEDIIYNFNLFIIEDNIFYSQAHRLNMMYKDDKAEKKRKAAQARLANLTPEQLSEQNKKAIKARWDKVKEDKKEVIPAVLVSDTSKIQAPLVCDTLNKDKYKDIDKDVLVASQPLQPSVEANDNLVDDSCSNDDSINLTQYFFSIQELVDNTQQITFNTFKNNFPFSYNINDDIMRVEKILFDKYQLIPNKLGVMTEMQFFLVFINIIKKGVLDDKMLNYIKSNYNNLNI